MDHRMKANGTDAAASTPSLPPCSSSSSPSSSRRPVRVLCLCVSRRLRGRPRPAERRAAEQPAEDAARLLPARPGGTLGWVRSPSLSPSLTLSLYVSRLGCMRSWRTGRSSWATSSCSSWATAARWPSSCRSSTRSCCRCHPNPTLAYHALLYQLDACLSVWRYCDEFEVIHAHTYIHTFPVDLH